jgi:hypothetical protein
MKLKPFLFFTAIIISSIGFGQGHGFKFPSTSYNDLNIKPARQDTSASVLFIKEFGEAYFNQAENYNLVFEYHAKFKILKQPGVSAGNFEISLYKQDAKGEILRNVEASSFNLVNGSIQETKLHLKNIFTEKRNEFWTTKKFAIPNVQVGTVVEIKYTVETPFIFNFRSWAFQSEHPKLESEYWALIPANYIYNMTLRGYLKFTKQESEIVKYCFGPGSTNYDCARYKFTMKDIPAFVEEDYMTASSNYIAALNFELAEIRHFDGRVDKVTKEWKDAEDELKRDQRFGIQLKRGKDIIDGAVDALIARDTSEFTKAKKIYEFMKGWYQWDGVYGKYSEYGIKKAFDKKQGNVGDINLSLIAALQYAGLNVEPVILSTRSNGLPIELHPVLSDFNYVIAKITINNKIYLADATDDWYPFGLIPERCLNGKGRVLGDEGSSWIDLKPSDKEKSITNLRLKLDDTGTIAGEISVIYSGYSAVRTRKKISASASQQQFNDEMRMDIEGVEEWNVETLNLDDLDKPLIQKITIKLSTEASSGYYVFNPVFIEKIKSNPFKSLERLYPVDFGPPIEMIMNPDIEYPSNFEVAYIPDKIGLALPDAGGRFIVAKSVSETRLTYANSLVISKPVYSSVEYHYLKELFNKVVEVHNAGLMFKKKI